MKIFISYARVNRKPVEALEKLLTDLGHDAWFDREITAGEDWWQSITSSIERCEVFVFALSPQSTNSSACQAEFRYALDLNKPILPVMLQEAELPVGKLRETQYVDSRNLNKRESIIALSKALSLVKDRITAGEFPAPNPPPSRPPFPFPPDPLANAREKIARIDALTEDELMQIVYELSSVARSGAKTERESLALLETIARNPRSTLRVSRLANEAIHIRQGRRSLLAYAGITAVVIVVVALAAVGLTNRVRNEQERISRETAAAESAQTLAVLSAATGTAFTGLTEIAGTANAQSTRIAVLEAQTQAFGMQATETSIAVAMEIAGLTQTAAAWTPTASATSTASVTPTNTPSPTTAPTDLPASNCTVSAVVAVNIRELPGAYAILGVLLPSDAPLVVFGFSYAQNGAVYYQVAWNDRRGWITSGAELTALEGDCDLERDLDYITVEFP
ncbi:MAG: toll/interleukin-1 receptor domain-containing protein [Anaerolinea sp.]|nr:toll/interleukin-1 receptor domain-containing protein [Anaerolinea sp.]